MNCIYNAQGFFVCNINSKSNQHHIVENFTDAPDYIQCSKLLNTKEATTNCPTCCIKNGLLWNNVWTNSNAKSYCQCIQHPKMQLYNDTNMISSPEMLNQMSAHIWSLGKININDCVNNCAIDNDCTYLTIDSNNVCWNSDMNSILSQKTFKSGIISGIKK